MEIWQNLGKNATQIIIFLPIHNKLWRRKITNENEKICQQESQWHCHSFRVHRKTNGELKTNDSFPEINTRETFELKHVITSRERPKSALYLKPKKRKVFKIVKMWTFWAFRNSSLFQSMKNGSLWRH